MARMIVPEALDYLFSINSTFALLDVREHGEYNTAHIPGSSSLPRRLLEFRVERLVPCKSVQVVVCDDDGERAVLAAQTLEQAGYGRVAVLDGGLNRWASEGFGSEWGMNVLSKDFGERVEVTHQVPTIDAIELRRRRQSGEDLVILDTRTPEEFQRACIPGGRSVPGGELALRITDIVGQQPLATVVVNCAGRTRSIIGARTLQRMGVRRVVSLRNGTSGWTLAGLQLEHGAGRIDLPAPSEKGREAAEAYALRVAEEDGVRFLDASGLESLMTRRGEESIYLIDVRTEEEFLAGHIPGFWWFPGGQAVQRADDVAAVRNGTIVFTCDGIARAAVAASWYRQMGFPNVFALKGGTAAWQEAGKRLENGAAEVEPIGLREAEANAHKLSPEDLKSALNAEPKPLLLFLDPSDEFAAGHIPGARWMSRSRLELGIDALAGDKNRRIVLTDRDGRGAALASAALASCGYQRVSILDGGMRAWNHAGLPIEQGLAGVMSPPNDVVPAGPDRGYADMVHYLTWEEALGRKYAPSDA
jgi:rhodanese-related sulfurtransferase